MAFITDKQTLADLNLTGKYRQDSIFNLFNKVHTTGGEKLLAAMFAEPLMDADTINQRSTVFQYFQRTGLSFPFTGEQLSEAENYLENGGASPYLSVWTNLLKKRVLAMTVHDEEYSKLIIGLQHTVAILAALPSFLNQVEETALADHPLQRHIQSARELLEDKRLHLSISNTDVALWPFSKLVKYDHLLRNILREKLTQLVDILYELDVYITIGNIARQKGFSYAEALPKGENILQATGLRHPGIDKAVANTLSLHKQSNLVFLTGANMAGKSTFMKTVGITLYLAHIGFPVAADQMQFSVKDGLYSSINVPDNLQQGFSHFYAEVLRVKNVATEVSKGQHLLVLFDELFKGTNVKDAYDATLAITSAFATYRNCLFIISTHITEVGEVLLQQDSNIQFLYLPTVMNGNQPTYTYTLTKGISEDKHGMMIIRNEGILEIMELSCQ